MTTRLAPRCNAAVAGSGGACSVRIKSFVAEEHGWIAAVQSTLARAGVTSVSGTQPVTAMLVLLTQCTAETIEWIAQSSRSCSVMVLTLESRPASAEVVWQLLSAGASEVLHWSEPAQAKLIASLERLTQINALLDSPRVRHLVAGESPQWRQLLREVVEASALTDSSVLITGESGTGKELLAQLIHDLDRRSNKGDLVVLDCATVVSELSGSEFFGHERGAFTGAVAAREGAFALANSGTLFLDEIGELPLPLQAQLLRVIQERKYKRVGSNTWQHTEFRLICATNRDLESCVREGSFRGDLYYRIAGWVCKVPPLRERPADILPLARHFLAQLDASSAPPTFDPIVQQFLLNRRYPGNVRELRQLVTRIWHRHSGGAGISAGDIPRLDRPAADATEPRWPDNQFELAIRRALDRGVGLKEINRVAAETAIRVALEQEEENVQRAARRLGVTDRAVQLRRAGLRAVE